MMIQTYRKLMELLNLDTCKCKGQYGNSSVWEIRYYQFSINQLGSWDTNDKRKNYKIKKIISRNNTPITQHKKLCDNIVAIFDFKEICNSLSLRIMTNLIIKQGQAQKIDYYFVFTIILTSSMLKLVFLEKL